MTLFRIWQKWFFHGLKILAGGFGAYLVVAAPIMMTNLLSEMFSDNPILGIIIVFPVLIAIPASIVGFGFLFTKLYTNSTWGYDATRDMQEHEKRKSSVGNPQISNKRRR